MPDQTPTHPLDNLVGAVTGKDGQGRSGMVVTAFLVLALVFVLAIFGIRLVMSKRNAAELARKLKKAEEDRVRAEEEAKLAQNSADRAAAIAKQVELRKQLNQLTEEFTQRKEDHNRLVNDLSAVTNWDDVLISDGRAKK